MISSGILVDTNMDTSSPDTYRAPPLPMPYDSKMSSVTSVNSQMLAHILNADAIENSATSEILKKSKDKEKIESTEVDDIKFEKLDELRYSESEDDDCPICLEGMSTLTNTSNFIALSNKLLFIFCDCLLKIDWFQVLD